MRTTLLTTCFAALCCLLAAALPVAAAAPDGPSCGGFLDRAGATAATAPLLAPETPPQLLFVALPPELIADGAEVGLEVTVDGAAFTRELLTLPGDLDLADKQPAVELLAYRGDLLARLFELADSGRDVELAVAVDGRPLSQLSWADLLAVDEALEETLRFEPLAASSTLQTAGEAVLPGEDEARLATRGSQACYQQCAYEFDLCDQHCDPYGGPNGCQACYDQLYECRDFCGICPIVNNRNDPPVVVSITPLFGQLCLKEHFYPYPNRRFYPYKFRLKHTVTRVSQNCDGTVTYTVISTTYSEQVCWEKQPFSSCYPHEGWEWSYCTF